ncbi:aldehyde dehydrogenase family protein [Peribacillus sp. SCS-26]|uniref:aldehyde dehydrogenase family protein n=1 Tax=Paraperibacillus marinus TaxID=3115295 RepID=UPI0039069384
MNLGLYINGEWVLDHGQVCSASIDPATEEEVGRFPLAAADQVDAAIESAAGAFLDWKKTPLPERAKFLWRASLGFEENQEAIAEVMTREMGKTLAESRGEIGVVIETCRYMAGEGRRLFGETTASSSPHRSIAMVREPIGVAACITPWNFPVAMAGYKITAALISGNTVVWKPASETALSAQLFTEVFHKAGIPAGVLNLITGPGSTVGTQLASHEKVKIISFTGSTEVGIQLAGIASKTLKRISLELGGKNAAIVLKDADLDLAAAAIVKAAFTTTGQRCTAASRVIAEEEIHDQLLQKVVKLTKALRIGNGLLEGVDIGPLVNRERLLASLQYVKDAVKEGAAVECGGDAVPSEKGYYFKPAVLSGVKPEDKVAVEEVFGPVLAFIKAASFEEAVRINNATPYGLSTSIFTNSLHYANRGAAEIESGLVYINNGTSNAEIGVAFGGTKLSGNGHREVSHHVFDAMTEWKTIYTNY